MSDEAAGIAQKLYAGNPAFQLAVTRFMALYDAAEVLGDLKPPHGDTAAAYLREVANAVLKNAGIPNEFAQAMINGRPPLT